MDSQYKKCIPLINTLKQKDTGTHLPKPMLCVMIKSHIPTRAIPAHAELRYSNAHEVYY